MSYTPHTDLERQQMLSAIGVTTIEDLFEAVPSAHRFPKLDLPKPMSEMDVLAEMQGLAEVNEHGGDFALFRGEGNAVVYQRSGNPSGFWWCTGIKVVIHSVLTLVLLIMVLAA